MATVALVRVRVRVRATVALVRVRVRVRATVALVFSSTAILTMAEPPR
jgi:hypothetical protein